MSITSFSRLKPTGLFMLIGASLFLQACSVKIPASGLKPEYPENRTGGIFDKNSSFFKIDSLRPFLRWEYFPTEALIRNDKQGLINQAKNVTYEIQIWDSQNDMPSRVIYSRTGLAEPQHKLEISLMASSKYFWTVRARFEINGEIRVTKWGHSLAGRLEDCENIYYTKCPIVPNPFLYRFQTP